MTKVNSTFDAVPTTFPMGVHFADSFFIVVAMTDHSLHEGLKNQSRLRLDKSICTCRIVSGSPVSKAFRSSVAAISRLSWFESHAGNLANLSAISIPTGNALRGNSLAMW